MDQRFKDIKIIAWDVDTTLYKNIPELSLKFKEECIKQVAKVRNLSFEEASKVFEEERNKWGSSALSLEKLHVGNFMTTAEIQERINKKSYIKKDPKVIEMFEKLRKFRHFIITNSTQKDMNDTLSALGLSQDYFEQIISVDKVGHPKPDLGGFKMLMEITGLSPQQHVYVGDREVVDIVPAKSLGMKTILVWGESKEADISLPTVYDVANVLI